MSRALKCDRCGKFYKAIHLEKKHIWLTYLLGFNSYYARRAKR